MQINDMMLFESEEGSLKSIMISDLLGEDNYKKFIEAENKVCEIVGKQLFRQFESLNSKYHIAMIEKMYKLGAQYGYKQFIQYSLISSAPIPTDEELTDTYYNSKECTAHIEFDQEDELSALVKQIQTMCGFETYDNFEDLDSQYQLEDGRVYYIQGFRDAISLLSEMSGKEKALN